MTPILGFCGYSGAGKTTLLAALIPALKSHGLRIACIKHSHHRIELDRPGKDSHTLRAAGAEQMILASRHGLACIRDISEPAPEASLGDALALVDENAADLVLVEGFKHESMRKIEVARSVLAKPLIHPHDPAVIALACDKPPVGRTPGLPVLDLNDIDAISEFILKTLAENMR